jgi:hypothetical protein
MMIADMSYYTKCTIVRFIRLAEYTTTIDGTGLADTIDNRL